MVQTAPTEYHDVVEEISLDVEIAGGDGPADCVVDAERVPIPGQAGLQLRY